MVVYFKVLSYKVMVWKESGLEELMQPWSWLWDGAPQKAMCSVRAGVVSLCFIVAGIIPGALLWKGVTSGRGGQGHYLNWGMVWAVEEGAWAYDPGSFFCFLQEPRYWLEVEVGEQGCASWRSKLTGESRLYNYIYPRFPAMFLKEVIQGDNKNCV